MDLILKYFLITTVSLLSFLLLILFLAYVTGRTQRPYNYLDANELISLAYKEFTVREIAEKFKPVVLINPSIETPKLLWVWYEIIEKDNVLDIVYYHNWENEINPNKNINRFYSIFRAAYYGYPLYDIEYFQIRVSKKNGNVVGVFYETSLNEDFYQILPEHIIVKLRSIEKNFFYGEYYTTEDQLVKTEELKPLFQENNILMGVQTWNHLSTLVTAEKRDKYVKEINAELKYLSEEDYTRHKFVRKSQGTNKTSENWFSNIIAIIAISMFTKLPAYIISKSKK